MTETGGALESAEDGVQGGLSTPEETAGPKAATHAFSQKWTLGEWKWFTTHWNYDGPDEKAEGQRVESSEAGRQDSFAWENSWRTCCRGSEDVALVYDKAGTGEYVLGRPPKKPGGPLRMAPFLLLVVMSFGSVECRADAEGSFKNQEEMEGPGKNFRKVVVLTLLLGMLASRMKLWELCKKFLICLHLVDLYECSFETFVKEKEIKGTNVWTTQKVLWTRLADDTLLWLERDGSAIVSFKENPEERVAQFFMRVNNEINDLLKKYPSS